MTQNLTRRQMTSGALATGGLLLSTPTWAQTRSVEDMVLGSPDAPVTVVEYASFTCPNCARFHTGVFPALYQNYIQPGLVRWVKREIYFDRYGLWGGMIARCDPSKYFEIVDVLLRRHSDWSQGESPAQVVQNLFAIGRGAGLTDIQMEACMQDQAWAKDLVAVFQKNADADGINATPTFTINGELYGNMSLAEFRRILDETLGY